MTKRILAAALFLASGRLKKMSDWCMVKSMRLVGFNVPAGPPPIPPDAK